MTTKLSKPVSALEDGVREAVRAAGGVVQPTIDGVAAAVFEALKDAGNGEALRDALPLIAGAAARAGARSPAEACYVGRGFMTGFLRAGGYRGERALEVIGLAATAFLSRSLESGTDVVDASRCLIEGAIVWAEEFKEDACAAASAAGRALVAAAGALGPGAARKVHDAVKDGVAGVDVLLAEELPAP